MRNSPPRWTIGEFTTTTPVRRRSSCLRVRLVVLGALHHPLQRLVGEVDATGRTGGAAREHAHGDAGRRLEPGERRSAARGRAVRRGRRAVSTAARAADLVVDEVAMSSRARPASSARSRLVEVARAPGRRRGCGLIVTRHASARSTPSIEPDRHRPVPQQHADRRTRVRGRASRSASVDVVGRPREVAPRVPAAARTRAPARRDRARGSRRCASRADSSPSTRSSKVGLGPCGIVAPVDLGTPDRVAQARVDEALRDRGAVRLVERLPDRLHGALRGRGRVRRRSCGRSRRRAPTGRRGGTTSVTSPMRSAVAAVTRSSLPGERHAQACRRDRSGA